MTAILCPNCHHDIDQHRDYEFHQETCGNCSCRLMPSDIARALLTAEPTEAEVEAGARALAQLREGQPWPDFDPGSGLTSIRDAEYREAMRRDARAALKAAREVRV